MDHPLQLASQVTGLTYQVNDAPKSIGFNNISILANAQVYVLCYYNGESAPWGWGFIDSSGVGFGAPFARNGYLKLYAMLKPQPYVTQIHNGTPSNTIDIGIGDGTDTDFDGVMGARITLSFNQNAQSTVVPYRGTPTTVQGAVTGALQTMGYLLDIQNPIFGGNANQYKSIQLQVDGDDHNVKMIEQMVWIHLFDSNGNLLGVVDTLDNTITNNTCNINLNNGFQMMAFIQGTPDPDNPTNGFVFSIGDPKTDVKIRVAEA